MATNYLICQTCSPAILNRSLTGLDPAHQDAVLAFLNLRVGAVEEAGGIPRVGPWVCDCCRAVVADGYAQAVQKITTN